MKVIWFEDKLSTRDDLEARFIKELINTLGPIGWEVPDIVVKDWHIYGKKMMDSGITSSEIWIIDIDAYDWLSSQKTLQEEKEEAINWWLDLLAKEKIEDDYFNKLWENKENLIKDRFKMWVGLGLVLVARKLKIPFLFSTMYDTQSGEREIFQYLSGADNFDTFLNNFCISKRTASCPTRSVDIIENLTKIKSIIPTISIENISSSEWRCLRNTGENMIENTVRNNISIFHPSTSPLIEFAKTFHPHHLKGGGGGEVDNDDYYDPKNWGPFFFTANAKNILTNNHYDINEWSETIGEIAAWGRPPIRALMQDDNCGNDLTKLIEIFRQDVNRRFNSDSKIFISHNNLTHDYLWFNATAICSALLKLLHWIKGDSNSNAVVSIVQIENCDQNDGLFCSLEISAPDTDINTKYPYNPNFPADTPRPTPHGFEAFCKDIFFSGASWVFYSGLSFSAKQEWNYHVIYPDNNNYFTKGSTKKWQNNEMLPPRVAFHLSPDKVSTPFRKINVFVSDFHSRFLVKDINDRCLTTNNQDRYIINIINTAKSIIGA